MNLDEVGDNFWSDNIDKFETQNESPSAIGQITPPSTEPNPDVSKTQVQDYTDSEDQSNVSKKQEVSSMRSYDRSSELTIPNSRSDDSNLVILSSQLENVSSQLETTLTSVSLQLKDVSYTLGVLKDLMKAVQREMGTQQKNLN